MALETATYVDALVTSNPDGADPRATADDHLRLIKAVLKRTFPLIGGAVSASAQALSFVNDLSAGVQAQLNALRDGSETAKVALTATNATTAQNALALGGTSASFFARLSSPNVFLAGHQVVRAGAPRLVMTSEIAPSGERVWYTNYATTDGHLVFGTAGDSETYGTTVMQFNRSATAIDEIHFYASRIYFNGQELTNPVLLNGIPASSYARLDAAQIFQKGVGQVPITVAESPTIALNMEDGGFHRLVLTASRILAAPLNPRLGQILVLLVVQGGSGSYGLTWNAAFRFPGGSLPTLSTAVGAMDCFAFIYDAVTGYWVPAGLNLTR